MASPGEEVALRRIIACFAPAAPLRPHAVARFARDARIELLGLYIEDEQLLRLAALPFAAEIGYPSATRRALDLEAMEGSFRAQAQALRQALGAVLDPVPLPWSLRVARGAAAGAVAGALAEGLAPALLVPPGADPRGARRVARVRELEDAALLQALIGEARPVLVLPG